MPKKVITIKRDNAKKLKASEVHSEILVGDNKPKATSRGAKSKMKTPPKKKPVLKTVRQIKEEKEGVKAGRTVMGAKVFEKKKPAKAKKGEQVSLTSYFKPSGKKKATPPKKAKGKSKMY
tara:strand:- start:7379 stop:7738 length:360 start_codon:yes stop_codon:yes gene_type:complete